MRYKLLYLLTISHLLWSFAECRRYGGSSGRTTSGGGWSRSSNTRTNSGSGSWSSSPTGSGGSHDNGNSNQNHGWKTSQPTAPQQNYGWSSSNHQQSQSKPTGGQNYGWTAPNQQHSSGQHLPNQTPKPQPNSNVWTKPNSQPVPSSPHVPNTQHVPNTKHIPNATPRPSQYHPPPPALPPSQVGQSYGWKKPTTYNHGNGNPFQSPPSSNIGPKGYPVQQTPSYYSGHTNYHSPVQQHMAQPSQHGFSPAYYPPTNHFGYPGQGMFGGSYGGNSMYGSPGHYGYPSSGGWGHQNSYGTGSNHDMLKGIVVGAVGSYLVNQMIHRYSSHPYGGGVYNYGNQYHYTTVPPQTMIKHDKGSGGDPDHWIHCIAYDPTTSTTLVNPNCSCTVDIRTDPATNLSMSTHNCSTTNGFVTEKTPTGRYAPDVEILDMNSVSVKEENPEKYVADVTKEDKMKKEFYEQLEQLVHMGKFTR